MYKAYKYRIHPKPEQQKQIDDTMSICRYIYNISLEVKITAWKSMQKNVSILDIKKQMTEAKKEFSWLNNASREALDSTLNNLEVAYERFFRGGGFPRFKSKRGAQSIRYRWKMRKVDFDKKTLSVSRIHDIPIILSRKFDGEIRIVTISKTSSGKYFASILVRTKDSTPPKAKVSPETTIGLDLGIKSYVATSDARPFQPNQYLKNSLKRLQCLQRRASRKKKGSGNRKKANLKVALCHEKIANQRADYIHKITTQLIHDNQVDTFVIEDLNVAGMVSNGKLSRSIADASFGEFKRQMKYKCEWYGKNLIVIDRFAPSSKRCSDCGTINQDLTLADREWTCVCGAHHDRDLNAAKNIKFFGLNTPVGSRGEPVESRRLRRAKKQEKLNNAKNFLYDTRANK